jgi:hypothetical protein
MRRGRLDEARRKAYPECVAWSAELVPRRTISSAVGGAYEPGASKDL